MFIHSFRYEILQLLRQKQALGWNLLFPILLSTFFYMAFGGLASDEQFHTIPVAVVSEHTENSSSAFGEVIEALSEPGEDSFLDVVRTDGEEALTLLEQKKIVGILYEGSPVTLSVSAHMSNMQLEQSILSCFVEQYNMQYGAMEQIAANHPEYMEAAVHALSQDVSFSTETSYSDANMDMQITYYFSLIAMTCLFASSGGLQVAVRNQANISALGARKGVSPLPKWIVLLGSLAATLLFQFLCVLAGFLYITCFLKISFGSQLVYVLLTTFLGCAAGVSFGFCVGSVGHLSEGIKTGVQMGITMLCSFLGGLMVGNIRIPVERYCPLLNRINPAALITDSFYALTIYQSHTRYFRNSISLAAITLVFCLCGFLITRRKKYAAL